MTPAVLVQFFGVMLATAGLTWLFGPWVLVGAGALLVLVPEVVEVVKRDAAAVPARRRLGRRP